MPESSNIVEKLSLMLGISSILLLTSLSSTLKPLILTWLSILPIKEIVPSGNHSTKSPVL